MSYELTENPQIEMKCHKALITIDNPAVKISGTEGLAVITQ
jgi:hypothetical protein